jgi:galactokinase
MILKQVLLPSKGKYHLSIPPSNDTNPPLRLLAAFQMAYPGNIPSYIVQAAGREMWIAATPTEDALFTLHAGDLKRHTRFTWRSAKAKQTHLRRPLPAWARYPAGVIVKVCEKSTDTLGINAVIVGAEAHGPRYDFSMGIAIATLWSELQSLSYQEEEIIQLVDQVRRDYVEVASP